MSHPRNLGHNLIRSVAEQSIDELVDLWAVLPDTSYTLSAGTSVNDESITVTDSTGISNDDVICIKEKARYYQGLVTGVVGNVVSLDVPLDEAFTTSAVVENAAYDLAVDGSSTTQVFKVAAPANATWHIYRIVFTITDNSAMDDSKFGGITALTNGVLIRASNGIAKNIFNVKSNSDFASIAYDLTYSDKAPAGSFGLRCRRTFNGEEKNGVVLALHGNDGDTFEFWVRDDLTDLSSFKIRVQGHRVSS